MPAVRREIEANPPADTALPFDDGQILFIDGPAAELRP